MNLQTPNEGEFEAFRRVKYVRVNDPLNQLSELNNKVLPVLQWHVDSDDTLLAVTVLLPGLQSSDTLQAWQCDLFMSDNRQILKVRKRGQNVEASKQEEQKTVDAPVENAHKEAPIAPDSEQNQPESKKSDYRIGITHSETSAFKRCRFAWDYSYRQKITSRIEKAPFYLGRLVHDAVGEYYMRRHGLYGPASNLPFTADSMVIYFLELAQKRIAKFKEENGDANLATQIEELEFLQNLGEAMIRGFVAFADIKDQFTLEPVNGKCPVEVKFEAPIMTPSGKPSPKFYSTGKVDALVKYLGHYWVHELKTAKVWNQKDVELLPIDPQVGRYIYGAEKHFGVPIAGAIYTVIQKNQFRLGKNETVEAFRKRVIADYAKRPDFYFIRNSIYINRDAVDQAAYIDWEVAKDMQAARIYRNVGKFTCGLGCDYKRLCTSTDEQQYSHNLHTFYRQKVAKHEELEDERD